MAAVLAFVIVLVGGAGIVLGRSGNYTAKTVLVLLPNKNTDPSNLPSYFDTLNSGQITATAGQILGLGKFKDQAGKQLHLSARQVSAISVSASVATGSSIVNVTVSAPSASDSERMADAVVNDATQTVNGLIAPYQLLVVSRAAGTATLASGLSSSKFLLILVIVALAVALGVQQAAVQIQPHLRRRGLGRSEPSGSSGDQARGDGLVHDPMVDGASAERSPPVNGRRQERSPATDRREPGGRRTKSARPPASGTKRVAPSGRR